VKKFVGKVFDADEPKSWDELQEVEREIEHINSTISDIGGRCTGSTSNSATNSGRIICCGHSARKCLRRQRTGTLTSSRYSTT
jgi:hypothetical protein